MSNANRSSLPGSERHLFPGAHKSGELDFSASIEVSIRLRSGSPIALPSGEDIGVLPINRREYMSPKSYDDQFGASASDLDQVRSFAREHGLREVGQISGNRILQFAGSAEQMSRAFGTQLWRYQFPGGEYRGREGTLSVPNNILPIIQGVFGLDNRPQALPCVRFSIPPKSGKLSIPPDLTTTPNSVASFYKFPQNLSGKGQCIGILEFGGGFKQCEITDYFNEMGVPGRNVTVREVGAKNDPGEVDRFDAEVALDIEMAGTIAAGAELAVYFAPATEKGWIDGLAKAIHDSTPAISVLSISWVFLEGSTYWTPDGIRAVNEILEEAANLGVTVCVASGDDGASFGADGNARVEFPVASPFVLACGGTSLSARGQNGEQVWNTGQSGRDWGATGGGVSDFEDTPTWQVKTPVNGNLPHRINPTFKGRQIPDVAARSDQSYRIFYHGDHVNVGGTSAAAPLWAGLVACLNEGTKQKLGFFNPLLYGSPGLQAACNDIKDGNNGPGGTGGYDATSGWDACTGWGSPDGTKLLKEFSR